MTDVKTVALSFFHSKSIKFISLNLFSRQHFRLLFIVHHGQLASVPPLLSADCLNLSIKDWAIAMIARGYSIFFIYVCKGLWSLIRLGKEMNMRQGACWKYCESYFFLYGFSHYQLRRLSGRCLTAFWCGAY